MTLPRPVTRSVCGVADSPAFSASETWGPVLRDGVQKQELTVIPYELQLDYDYWSYRMH